MKYDRLKSRSRENEIKRERERERNGRKEMKKYRKTSEGSRGGYRLTDFQLWTTRQVTVSIAVAFCRDTT